MKISLSLLQLVLSPAQNAVTRRIADGAFDPAARRGVDHVASNEPGEELADDGERFSEALSIPRRLQRHRSDFTLAERVANGGGAERKANIGVPDSNPRGEVRVAGADRDSKSVRQDPFGVGQSAHLVPYSTEQCEQPGPKRVFGSMQIKRLFEPIADFGSRHLLKTRRPCRPP